jgi:hypothetical protein
MNRAHKKQAITKFMKTPLVPRWGRTKNNLRDTCGGGCTGDPTIYCFRHFPSTLSHAFLSKKKLSKTKTPQPQGPASLAHLGQWTRHLSLSKKVYTAGAIKV